uniref:Uncharacterized protein n=1 Tax=viral metagenome TaxID=1070528 RepID=A0A6C0CMV4_9ZZZZ
MVDANHVKIAQRQNQAVRRRFTTGDSQYMYKVEKIKSLNFYIYVFIWIYVILAGFYIWIIFIGKKSSNYSISYKIAALIIIILFPYLITPIELFYARLITYIIETVAGNVYTRPDYEYVVDSTYIPSLFSY